MSVLIRSTLTSLVLTTPLSSDWCGSNASTMPLVASPPIGASAPERMALEGTGDIEPILSATWVVQSLTLLHHQRPQVLQASRQNRRSRATPPCGYEHIIGVSGQGSECT